MPIFVLDNRRQSQNFGHPVDESILSLCPVAFRTAMQRALADWTTLNEAYAEKFAELKMASIQSDQLNSARFANLFHCVAEVVQNVLQENSIASQKEVLSTQLHSIQVIDHDWNLFNDNSMQSFSEHERRHTAVMVTEYFASQLLSMVKDIFATNDQDVNVAEASAPDFESEQVLYYVGGFIVHKLLRHESTRSPISKEIVALLNACVLTDPDSVPAAADWTKKVDRGGLTLITPYCHDIFVSLEKFAVASPDRCPTLGAALADRDVDANVFRLASFGDYSDEAQDKFKKLLTKEFLQLRGKAMAKHLMENAVASDGLLQDRRGIRAKLQRLETQRNANS